IALLTAAIGLQWCARRAAIDASLVDAEHLAQHPLAAALVTYGALMLIGVPLTPAFATRWAAIALGGSLSPVWSLALVLALGAGIVGVLRVFGPLIGRQTIRESWSALTITPQNRIAVAIFAFTSLFLLYL